MNKVVLIGRTTADIELRTLTSGKTVCSFSLAVTREFKRDETDFINISAWGKTAEILSRYVRKGDRVGVSGRIRVHRYESDGQRRYMTEVVADSVELLTSKGDRRDVPSADAPAGADEFAEIDDDESDLPF